MYNLSDNVRLSDNGESDFCRFEKLFGVSVRFRVKFTVKSNLNKHAAAWHEIVILFVA